MLAVVSVRCLNCGSSDGIALIGVVIAAVALVVSFAALWIALREHSEFMRQLAARANLKLSAHALNVTSPDTYVMGTAADTTYVRVQIEIRNTGSRPARHTTLMVAVPGGPHVSQLMWANNGGTVIGAQAMVTGEAFGESQQTQRLSMDIPIVTVRTPVARWAQFMATQPPRAIPIRITAQSDDLPDDEVEAVLHYSVRIELASA